jgi:hypothetical protein
LITRIIFGEGYSLLVSLSCIQGKEIKLGTERSQSVENALWKRLWNCPKTDYRTTIIDDFMSPATIVCLCLHVKYQIFFSDFNKIWTFSKNFQESLHYQTSWKPVLWKPSLYTRTDRQTDEEANTHFLRIWESARKPRHFPLCFQSLALSSNTSLERICCVCSHFFPNKEPVF